jgi:hypothetical protein
MYDVLAATCPLPVMLESPTLFSKRRHFLTTKCLFTSDGPASAVRADVTSFHLGTTCPCHCFDVLHNACSILVGNYSSQAEVRKALAGTRIRHVRYYFQERHAQRTEAHSSIPAVTRSSAHVWNAELWKS